MSDNTFDFAQHLRGDAAGLDLHQVLHAPVTALAAVTDTIAAVLHTVGVDTVFDLGSSSLFRLAADVAAAADPGSAAHLTGAIPADWLHDGTPAADLGALPIRALRPLTADTADHVTTALDVHTIRDLACWPPRAAAVRMLALALGTTGPADEAESLRPRMGQYPTERVYYDRLVLLDLPSDGSLRTEVTTAIPITGAAPAGFGRIAVGALLTYGQSWYSQGITLGQLLHSLALAPGEATRIAVVDWSRQTSATTAESITETEQLANTTTHARALSEVQNAVAADMQQGGSTTRGWARSTSTAAAESGSSGLLGSGIFGSDSEATTTAESATRTAATSTSWSVGNRSVTANLEQHVNDRTEQYATAARNRRAAAVREVSQSEHEQVSTRIVANYNHMHALTVQYYEVVQIYRVLTRLHQAQRCLLVPLQFLDFAGPDATDLIGRFRAVLREAALTPRAADLLQDDTTSVAVLPVRPSKGAASPLAARPVAAVRARTTPATVVETAKPVTAHFEWEPAAVSHLTLALRRPIRRPGSRALHLPADAELTGLTFAGPDITEVRLDRPGTSPEANTYPVPDRAAAVDLPAPIPFDTITTIHVAKAISDTAEVWITLRCLLYGRPLETPPLVVNLATGTAMQRVATLETDRVGRARELAEHLGQHRAHYSQAVFRSLDPATIVTLLAEFDFSGRPLADQIEPTPLTVAGNFLIFRAPVEPEEQSGITGKTWGQALDTLGAGTGDDTRLIPIPTGGVFAEAVLGRSNAAEKMDITRFWNWQDSPAPLVPPEISSVETGSRAIPEDLRPGALSAPVVTMMAPTALPEPSRLDASLNALASGSIFRDMSGLPGTQGLAQAGISETLAAATAAGGQAGENLRAEIQRQIAQMQLAADLGKAAMGIPPTGGSAAGISGDGARINHGRDMDARQAGGTAQIRPSAEVSYADRAALGYSPDAVRESSAGLLGNLASGLLGGGSPAPARSRGSSRGAAMSAVTDFAEQADTPAFARLDRQAISDRLEDLVREPWDINQGQLFLCGPAVFFRVWIQRDPEAFVRFATDLYEIGTAKIGNLTIEPNETLRNTSSGQIVNWGIKEADWMLMSSLRDSENALLDYDGTPDEGQVFAGTTPDEVASWLRATGLYQSVRNETSLTSSYPATHASRQYIVPRADTILYVHSSMLPDGGDKPGLFEWANHFLLLLSPVTPEGGNVEFDFWSWGDKLCSANPTLEKFEDHYYGAIQALTHDPAP